MKLLICGKGGSGKSTATAMMAKRLAVQSRRHNGSGIMRRLGVKRAYASQ